MRGVISIRKSAMQGIRNQKTITLLCTAACIALFLWPPVFAQTIQPIIVEYNGKAGGKFQVTNNTLEPMAIALEPKSFSLDDKGWATYRKLDDSLHLELSTMSFRLEPKQTYYIFYKAHSDILPAWFTVYAVFSPIRKNEGLRVRIMLPHTVYLYQKNPIDKAAIDIDKVIYFPEKKLIVCDLKNTSQSLIRVQQVRADGGKTPVFAGGFPLLPGSPRHLEISWDEATPPSELLVHFPHFDVKAPIGIQNQ
jgi:hypothetical protein